ncbi:MAG TPA: phage holin family protein [Rhabdochlamydiaceae bacterium]|nr:phage holin family protein [Rhabdochlamydiaceae bacterium]
MIKFIIRVLILAGVIVGIAHLLPGLSVPHLENALIFAFVVAILNATITPILIVISFPLTVMTVGIFALLVNTFVFWLASLLSYGIEITSFWGAFWGGLIVWAVSAFLNRWLVEY